MSKWDNLGLLVNIDLRPNKREQLTLDVICKELKDKYD